MKRYAYFPGCSSSEGTAAAYGKSAAAIGGALGVELAEIEDWNCCGSTPYTATDELEGLCIAARNLAIAEKTGLDLVTPCSACFSTLRRANEHLRQYPNLRAKVAECLAAAGLEYNRTVRVRHLFEAIYTDIGLEELAAKVVNPLTGLKVAPYYGCLMVRPEDGFDDPENPQSMERFITSLGADPVPFPQKARCCSGSLVIPELELSLGLIHKILDSAAQGGAEVVVTVCPLCQTNLDAYQSLARWKFKADYELPVLFFTQLTGLALGIDPKKLALEKGIISADRVLAPFTAKAKQVASAGKEA